MQPQHLLIQLSHYYDFTQANQHLSNPEARKFARAWMAIDFSSSLAQALEGHINSYAAPYSFLGQFYKHQISDNQVKECDKRYASKADLELAVKNQQHFFEFHYLHQTHFTSSKSRHKLFQDVQRVREMRKTLPHQNVTLIIALWGSFTNEEIELFKPIDNNQHASYALDTRLKGSSQVSRLLHILKEGEPRLILVAV